ncbi:hypothetical protein BGZ83_003003, partial [Gryganskiella cystojenkinii]
MVMFTDSYCSRVGVVVLPTRLAIERDKDEDEDEEVVEKVMRDGNSTVKVKDEVFWSKGP